MRKPLSRILLVTLPPLLTAALGVTINLATDWRTNVYAWMFVSALTAATMVVAVLADRSQGRPTEQGHLNGGVSNSISGDVGGAVIQARDIHNYTTNSWGDQNARGTSQRPADDGHR
jgi:hypothetical protein